MFSEEGITWRRGAATWKDETQVCTYNEQFFCNYCNLLYNELQSCLNFSHSIYRQAGKQIQGAIRSAYKIERQAGGMQIFSPKAVDIEYVEPI